MNRKHALQALGLLALAPLAPAALASDAGSPAEAEALVKKTVALIKYRSAPTRRLTK